MNKELSLILKKALVFCLLLLVMDRLAGLVLKRLYFSQDSGKFHRLAHTVDETTAGILIFGSSHAVNHLDPRVFSNTMGMSCYNTGVYKQGILFVDVLARTVYKRHTPRIAVLCIDAGAYYKNPPLYDNLSILLPYYSSHKEVKEVVDLRGWSEPLKNFFHTYPYNSSIAYYFNYRFFPQRDIMGFMPKTGVLPAELAAGKDFKPLHADIREFDPRFIEAFESLISNTVTRGINAVVVASPYFHRLTDRDKEIFTMMEEQLAPYGLELWNYAEDPAFSGRPEKYYDLGHLNKDGAAEFSLMIAERLIKTYRPRQPDGK